MALTGAWRELEDTDRNLCELLNRRAELAASLGLAIGDSADRSELLFYSVVLREYLNSSQGLLPKSKLHDLFREIEAVCAPLLCPTRPVVACLGPPGSFTHLAASRWFATNCQYELMPTAEDAMDKLLKTDASYAVLAIDNATSGVVGDNIDLLADYVGGRFPINGRAEYSICGSLSIKISHCLLGSGDIGQIKKICSHPQGLSQCRNSIRRFREEYGLKRLELNAVGSTSEAAKHAVSHPGVAAIANQLTADIFGLKILRRNMEDNSRNATRFFLIGRETAPRAEKNRTMLCFRCAHPGAVLQATRPLEDCGVNMTMLIARPLRTEPWGYSYVVEIEGHSEDDPVRNLLKQMNKLCDDLKLIGSYPDHVLAD